MMTGDFVIQLLTSIGTSAITGMLFFMWLNQRFLSMQQMIDDQKARIKELEKENHNFLLREDHFEIRKEDKETIERQLTDMKKDIRDMPDKIVSMIRQFLNK